MKPSTFAAAAQDAPPSPQPINYQPLIDVLAVRPDAENLVLLPGVKDNTLILKTSPAFNLPEGAPPFTYHVWKKDLGGIAGALEGSGHPQLGKLAGTLRIAETIHNDRHDGRLHVQAEGFHRTNG